MSVSSSSLNLLGIIHSPCAFFYDHSTQQPTLIRPAMPGLVQCKNELDPNCSVLSTYSERSQTRLLTAIHLLQGICHGNPPRVIISYFGVILSQICCACS